MDDHIKSVTLKFKPIFIKLSSIDTWRFLILLYATFINKLLYNYLKLSNGLFKINI